MKRINKTLGLAAFGAVIAFTASVVPAFADTTLNPNYIDIHVSISNQKNITVDTTFYNYGPLAVAVSSVTSTPITVTNPATTGIVETYTVKGDTANADAGGVDWVLAASSGTNQYALAAQFSDNPPNDLLTDWASDDLNSTSAVTATSSVLGNGTPTESGAAVNPNAQRKLWFRIRMPDVVADPGHHKIKVTLSVL